MNNTDLNKEFEEMNMKLKKINFSILAMSDKIVSETEISKELREKDPKRLQVFREMRKQLEEKIKEE